MGCEVVVSGKLRGQRAKSMKFVDIFIEQRVHGVRIFIVNTRFTIRNGHTQYFLRLFADVNNYWWSKTFAKQWTGRRVHHHSLNPFCPERSTPALVDVTKSPEFWWLLSTKDNFAQTARTSSLACVASIPNPKRRHMGDENVNTIGDPFSPRLHLLLRVCPVSPPEQVIGVQSVRKAKHLEADHLHHLPSQDRGVLHLGHFQTLTLLLSLTRIT